MLTGYVLNFYRECFLFLRNYVCMESSKKIMFLFNQAVVESVLRYGMTHLVQTAMKIICQKDDY